MALRGGGGSRARFGPEASDRTRAGKPDAAGDEEADPRAVARTIALRALSATPKTRSEIEDLLARRGVPDDVTAELLDEFERYGWINDRAFASAWVGSRHTGRGLARRALAQELRRRGVNTDEIADAVDQLTPEQEEETARALVRRRLATMGRLDAATRTRRLIGLLERKGYSGGVAYRVVREELATAGEDTDGTA